MPVFFNSSNQHICHYLQCLWLYHVSRFLLGVRRAYVKFESRSEKSVSVRIANASYNFRPNVCVCVEGG